MKKSIQLSELVREHNNQKSVEVSADVTTGIFALDARLGGFQFGELILIGAGHEMGKTKFLLRVALTIAQQVPVFVYSQEHNQHELLNRLVSLKRDGGTSFFRDHLSEKLPGNLFENEQLTISTAACDAFEGSMLHIFHQVLHEGTKVVMIDYLQLLPDPSGRQSKIILLKEMCRSLGITVIITQLLPSKNTADHSNKQPSFDELQLDHAECQSIDIALLLHRPEFYGVLHDEKGELTVGKLEVMVAWNRGRRFYNQVIRVDF
jgi:replicative DNA helicase